MRRRGISTEGIVQANGDRFWDGIGHRGRLSGLDEPFGNRIDEPFAREKEWQVQRKRKGTVWDEEWKWEQGLGWKLRNRFMWTGPVEEILQGTAYPSLQAYHLLTQPVVVRYNTSFCKTWKEGTEYGASALDNTMGKIRQTGSK